MTLENIKLDIDYVRSQFPAFKDPLSKDWSFFENAGGSYVPKNVIDKLTEYWPLFLIVLIGGQIGNFLNLKIFN